MPPKINRSAFSTPFLALETMRDRLNTFCTTVYLQTLELFSWGDHGLVGYLLNIVEDLTPQLGGDLDGQNYDITTGGAVEAEHLYSTHDAEIDGDLLTDLDINKVDPEVTLTDSGTSKALKLKKVAASNLFTLKDNVISTGGIGNGLNFPDVNDYVTAANAASGLNSGDVTFSCWVNTAETGNSVVMETEDGNSGFHFQVNIGAGGDWHWAYTSNVAERVNSVVSLSDSVWHHVVGTIKRSTKVLEIWVDGVSRQSKIGVAAVPSAMNDILLGSRSGIVGFAGTLDEVNIWSKVLEDSEIVDLYNVGGGLEVHLLSTFPSTSTVMGVSLEACWHLNETIGSSAADSSANGYTGTLVNMTNADWVTGIVPETGTAKENTILQSRDGISALEDGSVELGAGNVRATMNGKTLRFQINEVEVAQIDANGDLLLEKNLSFPKASGYGIKLDTTTPVFGWRDLLGSVEPKSTGAGKATLGVWRGGVSKAWFYDAGDTLDILEYHIQHDYVPGSDLHIHLHWGHHGTAISGSLAVTFGVTYAKGHNRGNFPVEVAPVLTVATPNIATVPQYRHRVDEVQLSATTPSATQIDTNDIEPDGVILMGLVVTTEPTITGGVVNKTAFFEADIHYQSTNLATKEKVPDFYV